MKSKELSRLRWHVARCCHGRFGQDGIGRSSKPFRLIRLLPPVISFWGPIPLFPALARFPGDRHSLQLRRVIEARGLHPHATPKRVGSYLAAIAYNEDFATLSGRTRQNIMAQNLAREDSAVVPSCVFAGVGGYYASKQSGLAGVFRRAADGSDWKHTLSEIEAFTVFVHPRDPNLVFAGTADGVYRSTDRGQNFRRADFPARGVQVWSFLQDDADPKWMLAGGSPVSIYRSEDGGVSWKRMPDPQLPIHAKMPFSCRVMRFAPHSRRRGEIFAVLEVSGVMRSTDGGESWSDCSADLLRLAEAEPRLRSKLVSDTEAEGML